jgi:hypothetical protein
LLFSWHTPRKRIYRANQLVFDIKCLLTLLCDYSQSRHFECVNLA